MPTRQDRWSYFNTTFPSDVENNGELDCYLIYFYAPLGRYLPYYRKPEESSFRQHYFTLKTWGVNGYA